MRKVVVAAAQLGPVSNQESRSSVVRRLVDLMYQAHLRKARWIVFPELALTTFFPREILEEGPQLDQYFETAMPGADTQPLFERAAQWNLGFSLGYAEKTVDAKRFNTSVLVDGAGRVLGKYRKIHLPGGAEVDPARRWQHLEKRYFSVGDLGFPVWRTRDGVFGMSLCNDRRWTESFRVQALQGVELTMIGYCTPVHNTVDPAYESAELRLFQHQLCMQAGAYQNATFVIGAAKAGIEEGCAYMSGSMIVAPSGEIVAQAQTDTDELVAAEIDLDDCLFYQRGLFNFEANRQPEHYGLITSQRGALAP